MRRIVPDASVIIPYLFPEDMEYLGNRFDLSRRARPCIEAILRKSVLAIAPEFLVHEVFMSSHRKIDEGIDPPSAARQFEHFLYLWDREVRHEPLAPLATDAWRLTSEHAIAPPDSWYLACAIRRDAELWISHRHADGFADKAAAVHSRVYVLTEHKFAATP